MAEYWMLHVCKKKKKKKNIGHWARGRDKSMSPAAFISGLCNFMLHFSFRCAAVCLGRNCFMLDCHFWCAVHATFDRNLDSFSWHRHLSYGTGGLRTGTQLKTLSSLLYYHNSFLSTYIIRDIKCLMCLDSAVGIAIFKIFYKATSFY